MSWAGGDFGGSGRGGGARGILQGLHICVTGKQSRGTRKQIQAEILAEGGTFCSDVQQRCTTLIATVEEVRKPTRKVSDARGRGIPIVSEAWLEACFDEGGQVDPADYLIDDHGGPPGRARAPVHVDGIGGGGTRREPTSTPRVASDSGHRLGGAAAGPAMNPREAALIAAERRQQTGSVTSATTSPSSSPSASTSGSASDDTREEELQLKEAIRQSLELAQPEDRERVSLLSTDEEEEYDEEYEEEATRATHLAEGDAVRLARGVVAADAGPLIHGRAGTIRRVHFEDDDDTEPFQVVVVVAEAHRIWWYGAHQLVKVTPSPVARSAPAPKRQRERTEISLVDTDDDANDDGDRPASKQAGGTSSFPAAAAAGATAVASRMISVDIVAMDMKQLKQELKKRGEKLNGKKIELQRSKDARRERFGSTIG